MIEASMIETTLAAERPRLVRLCARLSGNWDAAEDLAQETLFQAWHHADRLHEWRDAAPWLSAIARNVCLNWSRRHYREQGRLASSMPLDATDDVSANSMMTAQFRDDFDLEVELERAELATLLDRALALLPPETRAVLVQKYVEGSPYAEIAANLGLNENAVAVRAHRGKLAFQRILTNELRTDAAAFGLLNDESESWTETRLWCLQCGNHRLAGRFDRTSTAGVFVLRCPGCSDGDVTTHVDFALPFFAAAVGNVKTYKPAYTRILTSVNDYCREALADGSAPCLVCGHAIDICPSAAIGTNKRAEFEMRIRCATCHWEMNNTLCSLALIHPNVQQFWRTYPRLRTLPTREVDVDGCPALVVGLRSVTDAAGLNVIAVRDTFEVIRVNPVSTT